MNNRDQKPEPGRSSFCIGSRNTFGSRNVIGNNNVISNYMVQEETQFSMLELENYDETKFTGPAKTGELIRMALDKGFLVLGGVGYDKPQLALHIARVLQNELGDGDRTVPVWKWIRNTNDSYQNPDHHLVKDREPGIFILPGFSPRNVEFNLQQFYHNARRCNKYLLIITDEPLDKWEVDGKIKKLFWQPAPGERLYLPEDLLKVLLKQLAESPNPLLQDNTLTADGVLTGNLRLKDAAFQLKTPGSIEGFVNTLSTMRTNLTEENIRALIAKYQADNWQIRQWFHQKQHKEQLITLGLCIFEGLYDDQFFAAMEYLVEHSWYKWDQSLKALDYSDLDKLRDYFNLARITPGGVKKIHSPDRDQRKPLLEAVWDSHRRLVLNTLGVMEKLVEESVHSPHINTELYGSHERCKLLRDVIAKSLCAIGLKPQSSIKDTLLEDTLLRMAAQEEIEIQVVVANALAGWREYRQDVKLFDTLERWQYEATIRESIDAFLENREEKTSLLDTPETYIKATVTLTIGFCARFDPPDQLNPQLVTLLEQLAVDTENDFIRNCFSKVTLPLVVRHHVNQLRGLLESMSGYMRLNWTIGDSLAFAYDYRQIEVAEILDSWFHRCRKNRPKKASRAEISSRDKLMATVAYAYGYMQYENNSGPITIDDGFKRLKTILREEINDYIRDAAVFAIVQQTVFHFEKIENRLAALFQKMHQWEIEMIINQLVEMHLEQRINLKGGQESLTWEDNIFPVWFKGDRPATAVEKIIRKWLKDSGDRITKQMAFRFKTSPRLLQFEKVEEGFIEKLKKKLKEDEEKKRKSKVDYTPPEFNTGKDSNKISVWLVSWLVTFQERKNLDTIRWLLPVVMNQKMSDREILDFVLGKMQKDSDDELKTIAEQLQRASVIMSKKKQVLVFVVLLAAAVLYLLLK